MSEILSESEFSKAIKKFKNMATPEAEKFVKTLEHWRKKEVEYLKRVKNSGGELKKDIVKSYNQRKVNRIKDIRMLRKEAGSKLKTGFLTKINNIRKQLGLKKIATVSGALIALGIGAKYLKKYRDKKQEEKRKSVSEQFIFEMKK